MLASSVATVGVGLALVWALVRPGVVEGVGTTTLLGVVALLLAPGVTLAALRLDRAAAATAQRRRREALGEPLREPDHAVVHEAEPMRFPHQRRRARADVGVPSAA